MMTIAIVTVMPAPRMIQVRIQSMEAVPIEGQAKIAEKDLTEGAT